MTILLDTNVAIHFRDQDRDLIDRVIARSESLAVSVITVVELESGINRDQAYTAVRRAGVNRLLETASVIDCDPAVASAYGAIIAAIGFSRSKLLDRLIAATAIVHGLTLVTINGSDFRDIPGLSLEIWPTAQ